MFKLLFRKLSQVLLQYKFAIIVNNRVSKYLDKDNVVNLNELSHTHITGFLTLFIFFLLDIATLFLSSVESVMFQSKCSRNILTSSGIT